MLDSNSGRGELRSPSQVLLAVFPASHEAYPYDSCSQEEAKPRISASRDVPCGRP